MVEGSEAASSMLKYLHAANLTKSLWTDIR